MGPLRDPDRAVLRRVQRPNARQIGDRAHQQGPHRVKPCDLAIHHRHRSRGSGRIGGKDPRCQRVGPQQMRPRGTPDRTDAAARGCWRGGQCLHCRSRAGAPLPPVGRPAARRWRFRGQDASCVPGSGDRWGLPHSSLPQNCPVGIADCGPDGAHSDNDFLIIDRVATQFIWVGGGGHCHRGQPRRFDQAFGVGGGLVGQHRLAVRRAMQRPHPLPPPRARPARSRGWRWHPVHARSLRRRALRKSQGVSVPIHPAKVLATSTDSRIRAT